MRPLELTRTAAAIAFVLAAQGCATSTKAIRSPQTAPEKPANVLNDPAVRASIGSTVIPAADHLPLKRFQGFDQNAVNPAVDDADSAELADERIRKLNSLIEHSSQDAIRTAALRSLVREHAGRSERNEILALLDRVELVDTRDGAWASVEAAEALLAFGVAQPLVRQLLSRAVSLTIAFESVPAVRVGLPGYVWHQSFHSMKSRILIGLATLEFQKGRLDQSERLFGVLFRMPDSGGAHVAFARLLENANPERAAVEYCKAIALADEDDPVVLGRVRALEIPDIESLIANARSERSPARQERILRMRLDEELPEFLVDQIGGGVVDAQAVRRSGKIVLLNFFHSGCPYSLDEQPTLERVRREFPDDIEVMVVGFDGARNLRRVAQREFTYAVTRDQSMRRTFGAWVNPVVFVVSDGRIVFRNDGFGPGTELTLMSQVAALLRERRAQRGEVSSP